MSSGEATRARVREIVTEQLGRDAEHVQDDHELVEDLGADSLDLVEIAMDLEDEYGIDIEDETATRWVTVGDVVRWIETARS